MSLAMLADDGGCFFSRSDSDVAG